MTYAESFAIAEAMGYTKSASWKTGVNTGKPGYSVTTMTVGASRCGTKPSGDRLHRSFSPGMGQNSASTCPRADPALRPLAS